MSLAARFRALLDEMAALPVPGGGNTATRHRRLYDWARHDVSLARLAEAHTDALAILHEAGRRPVPGACYGVWAAEQPGLELRLGPAGGAGESGPMVLSGHKAFCTGAGIVDRALITVRSGDPDAPLLVDVAVHVAPGPDGASTLGFAYDGWITAAFADTRTATASFVEHPVADDAVIGPPGWYLQRPGFWRGAIGPACCWAGGAAGLVDLAERDAGRREPDPLRELQLGALVALRWRVEQLLEGAGGQLDADAAGAQPFDPARLALIVRQEIDVAAGEIVDRFSRSSGPRALAFDAATSVRISEVQLYRRQCHAEHDLAVLGGLVRNAAGAATDQASWRTDGSRS